LAGLSGGVGRGGGRLGEPAALHLAPVGAAAQVIEQAAEPPEDGELAIAEIFQAAPEDQLELVAETAVAVESDLLEGDGGDGENHAQAVGAEEEERGEPDVYAAELTTEMHELHLQLALQSVEVGKGEEAEHHLVHFANLADGDAEGADSTVGLSAPSVRRAGVDWSAGRRGSAGW
jgi:hypothetical protein